MAASPRSSAPIVARGRWPCRGLGASEASDLEEIMQGTDIEIPRPDGATMPGYAALPAGAQRGVVVIHEILGRQPEIDRVVERFAAAGYAAVGPDLFHAASRIGCIRRALATIGSGEGSMADNIFAAQRWLCERTGLAQTRVGVIGFCLGGGLALAVGREFGVVSSNYGDLPPVEVLRGSPPIIGCYGGRDRAFRGNAERLRGRMNVIGSEVEVHTFPTVGHSFLTDGDHGFLNALTRPLMQIRYDSAVAEDGWQKILAFFDRTLPA
jgi:carboxymethylenebutenolidase